MERVIDRTKLRSLIVSIILFLGFILWKPFGMSFAQSIVLGGLFVTVSWWVTGSVKKEAASIFLLLLFTLFGKTPVKDVFFFPLSENIIMVVTSYLLSQGIVNSKIADRFSVFFLSRYCKNMKHLVIMSYILSILLIFIIPQPFPRVIILASIYSDFLKKHKIRKEAVQVAVFGLFVASSITSTLLLNGDVILNYIAIHIGNVDISYFQWILYLTVPSLLTMVMMGIGFIVVFRKELLDKFDLNLEHEETSAMTKEEYKAIGIMSIVVVLWLTYGIHGISPSMVALIGTIIMFAIGLIGIKDFKVINIGLLIFLTAGFSIGKVLNGSGIAVLISNSLMTLFPDASSPFYYPVIIGVVSAIHMVSGSSITAMSIAIPTLTAVTGEYVSTIFITMLVYIIVSIHYVLPMHHVTIMIGYGNNYYENKHVVKYGIFLTILLWIVTLCIYIPWWKFIHMS